MPPSGPRSSLPLRSPFPLDGAIPSAPDVPSPVWTFPQRQLVIASLLLCPDAPGRDVPRRSRAPRRL